MSLPEIAGVVPILVTPFDDRGRIDRESLQRLVEFTISGGVHGIGIALGSEVYKLTEAEREFVITTVVEQTKGRVPIVINTGAPATDLAVFYSQGAEALGAKALMCTPPGPGYSAEELIEYYGAISDAVTIPVFIQDTSATPVPAGLIRTIGVRCERVRYAKVESTPPPNQVLRAVEACGDSVAIFGGAAGQYFLEELRRGAIGTMPWPSLPHAFVRVWDRWQVGERAAAREVFEREIAPLLRLSVQSLSGGHRLHKEVLRRQGIIASAHVRRPAEELDPITLEELDEVCAQIGIGQAGQ